jgi:hypothetical protein
MPRYDPKDPNSLDLRSCFVAQDGKKVVVADYCLGYGTKILTTDLRWVNIEDVKVGETLISVDEESIKTDINGKPVIAYNFKSFMIPKNTINDWVWVTIFVPTSSMLNDTKRQKKVEYTYKTNGVTKLTQNHTLTGSAPYSIIVNYTGNRIPQGTYRVISTWTNTNMRVKLNKTDDVYFRGNGN